MADDTSSNSQSSVGNALKNNLTLGINHPVYKSLESRIERRTVELAETKGNMRRSTPPYYMTLAMKTDEIAYLASIFPEFRIINLGTLRAAHVSFVALRRLSIAWCVSQARKLTMNVVVYGTPIMDVLESNFESATMYADASFSETIHERHSCTMDAYRIYMDYVRIGAAAGVSMDRVAYDCFLQRKKFIVTNIETVTSQGDVMCVDGVLREYTPYQVALMMMKHKSSIAYGTFPYHPTMLLNTSGMLGDYGVRYTRSESHVSFQYPDGIAGVNAYSLVTWISWLSSYTFQVGKKWFQIELLKNRDCIMFYRMVRLETQPADREILHALELPSHEPQYVVRSWRLRKLGMDPAKSTSWNSDSYLVSKRLVDRVYQMVMTLPREQFTRFAVRKQLRVVNDRTTIDGTTVKVNRPLDESLLDALVADIFCRAFADRYAAGTLTEYAKTVVERISGFSSMSRCRRLWALMSMSAIGVWEFTVGRFDDWVREKADWLNTLLDTKSPVVNVPSFEVAPSYVLLDGYFSGRSLVRDINFMQEVVRRSGAQSRGMMSAFSIKMSSVTLPKVTLNDTFTSVIQSLFDTPASVTPEAIRLVELTRGLNEMDEATEDRRQIMVNTVARHISGEVTVSFNPVPSPVYILNEFYSRLFPGLAEQNLEYDTASISLDPQDRHLAAPYMKLPRYFGDVPRPRNLFHSRLRALNVPKRQQTLQELISAITARNCNAPQVALPQDDKLTALAVWNNFLAKACVPEAREMLRVYQRDPVALEQESLREWVTQSTPDKVAAVIRDIEDTARSLGDMDVGDYLVMLKSDVKPTLSKKPMFQRTEAQVIVYHEKPLSAFYSSIFRVLSRRFLSLLRPNYHVNLLKDTKDMEAFVAGIHPYGRSNLAYLENDFSKYDKSQGRFVFILEQLIFEQLGMNKELLAKWLGGHEKCNLRAVGLGLSLHVLYQRKSGDATTAFGNVLLNITSVLYAYKPTIVFWGVFMGDDSLVCTLQHQYDSEAVAVLAEVFNLGAKMYCTNAPYFASNFIVVNDTAKTVYFIPDPVKRVERWSMMVSGDDPQWDERYISARDAMVNYLNCAKTSILPHLVSQRYGIKLEATTAIADAMATIINSKDRFREIWEEEPEQSFY